MNSPPLSESIPSNGKGNLWRMRWIASETASCERWSSPVTSVQPVERSVQVHVFRYWPSVVLPQCATRSISRNPGRSSSHSVKVRTGMRRLSRLPGLVVRKPCADFIRTARKQRSMLAELIFRSRSLLSAESSISWQRYSTRMASGKNGCNRFEQICP